MLEHFLRLDNLGLAVLELSRIWIIQEHLELLKESVVDLKFAGT